MIQSDLLRNFRIRPLLDGRVGDQRNLCLRPLQSSIHLISLLVNRFQYCSDRISLCYYLGFVLFDCLLELGTKQKVFNGQTISHHNTSLQMKCVESKSWKRTIESRCICFWSSAA